MKVFITLKQSKDKHGQVLDVLESNYVRYFNERGLFGLDAIFIPLANHLENVKLMCAQIKPDYIVITGGNNVVPEDPTLYNQIGDYSPERDVIETFLIDYADQCAIPKLAICRGFQFLNVHYGGELSYNLIDHPPGQDHVCDYQGKRFMVNSFHDHGIYKPQLAKNLRALATTSTQDQTLIEGYTNADESISPTLAVQWHPERGSVGRELFELLWGQFKR